MKHLITILVILTSFTASSQVKQLYNQYGGTWKRLEVKVGFRLPLNDSSTKDLNSAAFDTAQVYYNPADSSVYYYTGSQWLALSTGASSSRFGVSGEDDTPSQNRIVGFTSTYVFNARHLSSLTFDADSSNGSGIGYSFLGLNKFENTSQIGTAWRSGGTGHGLSWVQSKWNGGDTYIELATYKNSDANLANYFRAYNDSLVIRLNGTAKLKAKGILPGAGTVALRWNPASEEITYADTTSGGGSGTNNANVGSGYRWLKPSTQEIKTFFAGTGVSIDSVSNTDGLTISSTGEANTASNVGSGAGVWKDKVGVDLRFRSLVAGDGIGIVENTNDITITSTASINDNYRNYTDMSGQTMSNFYLSPAGGSTGAAISIASTAPSNSWFFGRKIETGTTSTGRVFGIPQVGAYTPVAISTSQRFSCGIKLRFEDLPTVGEDYNFFYGFGDDANAYASIVDGIGFRMNRTDSSGQFIAFTKSNSTTTEAATGVTVAADTDYRLQLTGIGGSFYFYINGSLVATISTNIPTGTARETSLVFAFNKTAGTTNRVLWLHWIGYDMKEE